MCVSRSIGNEKCTLFQVNSALVVTAFVVAITQVHATSHHEGGGHVASTARTSQDVESLTEVYFIIALAAMALLFVVLGVDALTGHNFVNNISGSSGDGLSIARGDSYPFSLSSFGIGQEELLSIMDSISR